MGYTRFSTTKFACLFLLSVCAGGGLSAHAQNPSPGEIMEATAKLFGIDKTSRFFASFGQEERVTAPIMSDANRAQKRGIDEGEDALKIVRHYRASDEGGVKFPTAKEARNPFLQNAARVKGFARDAGKVGSEYIKKISDPANLPLAPRALTNCTKSGTEKKKISVNPSVIKKLGLEMVDNAKEAKEVVLFDYLFLRKEDVPINPAEVFGKSAVLRVYEGEPQSSTGYAAAAVNVPCLPFRVRGTRLLAFRHQGIDALKNYDSQPSGNGKMHDLIKAKRKREKE